MSEGKKEEATFTRAGDILKSTLEGLNLHETFKVFPIAENWEKIVGSGVAQKATPDFVRGETLFVSVQTSVWMQELEMQKSTILGRIKELNLSTPITSLRFRLARS